MLAPTLRRDLNNCSGRIPIRSQRASWTPGGNTPRTMKEQGQIAIPEPATRPLWNLRHSLEGPTNKCNGEPLKGTERTRLVESLTGRWTAFHRRAGVLCGTPVYHEPWPLRTATITGKLTAPLRWVGLPEPTGEPLVHAASAVQTRLGLPRRG